MSDPAPRQLGKTDQRTLKIEWTDGFFQELTYWQLRRACPCASCRKTEEEESVPSSSSSLPVLTEAQASPLEIVSMRPVGNYGYNIQFSDGHSTGIYTLDLLRSLQ
ncbi:MAG: DUF971 domain-containing protein [Mariniblastus sp.]|nr:DUF971 domain-containing protein [Mariniblastus sp.]